MIRVTIFLITTLVVVYAAKVDLASEEDIVKPETTPKPAEPTEEPVANLDLSDSVTHSVSSAAARDTNIFEQIGTNIAAGIHGIRDLFGARKVVPRRGQQENGATSSNNNEANNKNGYGQTGEYQQTGGYNQYNSESTERSSQSSMINGQREDNNYTEQERETVEPKEYQKNQQGDQNGEQYEKISENISSTQQNYN